MKISVYGSSLGGVDNENKEKAREIGREIAIRGHILITGACPGYPYEAVLGAYKEKGQVIGYSPGISLIDHVDRFGFPTNGFSELIFTPKDFPFRHNKGACLKLRNVYSVAASDAVIVIGGRWGTVNEFSIAYDLGRNIGVLEGSGGFTNFIMPMRDSFKKESVSQIIFRNDPRKLVADLCEVTK